MSTLLVKPASWLLCHDYTQFKDLNNGMHKCLICGKEIKANCRQQHMKTIYCRAGYSFSSRLVAPKDVQCKKCNKYFTKQGITYHQTESRYCSEEGKIKAELQILQRHEQKVKDFYESRKRSTDSNQAIIERSEATLRILHTKNESFQKDMKRLEEEIKKLDDEISEYNKTITKHKNILSAQVHDDKSDNDLHILIINDENKFINKIVQGFTVQF